MPDAAQLARARHRLYGLLGRLFADGLTDDVRPVVEALPALAPLLALDAEPLAVEHHRWFAFELSAHESAFVDGALNSAATAQVRATFTACGFASRRTDLEPDHVAMHFGALSFLCATELEARQDGLDASPIQELQQRVLEHLVAWFPLLVNAVAGPWRAPLDLAEELVLDHFDDELPSIPEPVSLSATALLTPGSTGWVCTWTDLRAASSASGCALGFGSKRRAVRALLDDEQGRVALAAVMEANAHPRWKALAGQMAEAVRRVSQSAGEASV